MIIDSIDFELNLNIHLSIFSLDINEKVNINIRR